MKKIILIFTFIVFFFSANATTYYVSKSGNNNNNGLSWATAMYTIQAAINSANSSDSVFVSVGNFDGFTLKSGVHIFGGFTGTETYLYQRQNLAYGYLQNGTATKITTTINRLYGYDYKYFNIFSEENYPAVVTTYIDGIVIRNSSNNPYISVLLRGSYVLKNSSILDVYAGNAAVFCREGNP